MTEDTFIIILRRLIDWEWFKDSKMVHIFIYLLLRANYKPGRYRGVVLDRGQVLTGRNSITESTGISGQSVRTCLKRLQLTNEITIKSTKKYSIITICNYDSYQNIVGVKKPKKQPTEIQYEEPTDSQDLTTYKQLTKLTKVFIQPTLLEVEDYFSANGFLRAIGKKAFDYYSAADWTDSKGKKVRNWKQKMQGVWFTDENRDTTIPKVETYEERQRRKALMDGQK